MSSLHGDTYADTVVVPQMDSLDARHFVVAELAGRSLRLFINIALLAATPHHSYV